MDTSSRRQINCWRVLKPNSPKHVPCSKDACLFIEKSNWPTLNVKKKLTLARFNWSLQAIFGPGRIDCSIKMDMRYSSILFDHTSVDTSSYMAGFHIGPLYLVFRNFLILYPPMSRLALWIERIAVKIEIVGSSLTTYNLLKKYFHFLS